jgi:integrase
MARRTRSAKLETRTARLKLPARKKPHAFTTIAPGIALAYRRNQGAGTWVVRVADGRGSSWQKAFGIADDHEDADGEHVLDFWQAQDRARALARGKDADAGRPGTVAEAIDDYARNLKARGAGATNATRVLAHISPTLLAKPVALLTARELRRWRDDLIDRGLKPPTVSRTAKALAAALSLAAKNDPRISNRDAWRDGLAGLADVYTVRNVIVPDEDVRTIIAAAAEVDGAVGLLIEAAAVTGARVSQLARLEIADLQDDRPDPRLMMPSSRKGKNRKVGERKPVPISASLAAKLRRAAGTRLGSDPLLLRPNGEPWCRSNQHLLPFAEAVARAGLDRKITMGALRHSSIVRMLLAGVPARVVASVHDTSVQMLERTYSRFISDHSDALTRRAMLDTAQPPAENVDTLPGRRSS